MLAGAINRIHRVAKRKGHGVRGERREARQRLKVKREILRRAALAQENGSCGAVRIELRLTLKARKLLIRLSAKNAKNIRIRPSEVHGGYMESEFVAAYKQSLVKEAVRA